MIEFEIKDALETFQHRLNLELKPLLDRLSEIDRVRACVSLSSSFSGNCIKLYIRIDISLCNTINNKDEVLSTYNTSSITAAAAFLNRQYNDLRRLAIGYRNEEYSADEIARLNVILHTKPKYQRCDWLMYDNHTFTSLPKYDKEPDVVLDIIKAVLIVRKETYFTIFTTNNEGVASLLHFESSFIGMKMKDVLAKYEDFFISQYGHRKDTAK